MPASSQTSRHPAFATTLANGLAVLQCFRAGDPILSNRDLAERTGLSKATVSRLTYTLCLKGLLMHDAQLRRYRLGAGVLSLSHALLSGMRLRQLARPLMRELAAATGGTASLGVYDQRHMVYVETSRGHDLIAFRPDIGARLPVMASAMGRAWLAGAGPAQRQAVLDELERHEPEQLRKFSKALAIAVEDWKAHGYCVSEGDWQADVHAVGVPLRMPVDGERLVFNCGVRVERLGAGGLRKEVAPKLRAMVDHIERLVTDGGHG
ncbi:IclR family transcriptional regulator [Parapusillimonas granuli]|uniref:IclR family transcriptional regulator n=1 Tax=Parapusillimonas granuli TaxID=380911 RepID=A0A853FXX5_9BURK|nr:IclR family transcriptional regulator [Parapusillimonas granuli]MBB5215615.1 DNA-binding IclR family transcriptional regulator [Parapusillimonas granuli]MEB2401007.1 IclR family transcriptional regulator [Alcaligenaceae bacterium]NYT49718.1 IclR family transcriptional regulator [Parapusillimonas granuli]